MHCSAARNISTSLFTWLYTVVLTYTCPQKVNQQFFCYNFKNCSQIPVKFGVKLQQSTHVPWRWLLRRTGGIWPGGNWPGRGIWPYTPKRRQSQNNWLCWEMVNVKNLPVTWRVHTHYLVMLRDKIVTKIVKFHVNFSKKTQELRQSNYFSKKSVGGSRQSVYLATTA